MIYKARRTKEAREYRHNEWNKWFAWFPVTIFIHPDGFKEKVWLETVERKLVRVQLRIRSYSKWNYRLYL